MKTILIVLIFTCFKSIAQTDTTYFGKDWNECSKEVATYYNITSLVNGKYITKDYFISGQLQMIGEVFSPLTNVKNGNFIFYHENGNIKSEGNYILGKKEGEYKWYFKNGNKEAVENYSKGKLEGKYIEYFANGNINYKVNYKNDKLEGDAEYYHLNGENSQIGKFNNNQKIGKWDYWFENGEYASYEMYDSYFEIEKSNLSINFENNNWHLNKPENTSKYSIFTFKRTPIKEGSKNIIPNISFMIEDTDSKDVITYSTLKRINIPFEVVKVLSVEKGDLSIENSIGYIGKYIYENGENHTIFIIHSIYNKKGIQIIFDTTEDTYKEIETEFKEILKNIKAIK